MSLSLSLCRTIFPNLYRSNLISRFLLPFSLPFLPLLSPSSPSHTSSTAFDLINDLYASTEGGEERGRNARQWFRKGRAFLSLVCSSSPPRRYPSSVCAPPHSLVGEGMQSVHPVASSATHHSHPTLHSAGNQYFVCASTIIRVDSLSCDISHLLPLPPLPSPRQGSRATPPGSRLLDCRVLFRKLRNTVSFSLPLRRFARPRQRAASKLRASSRG